METRSVEAIVRGLNTAGVRYLIAGGLAVVAYGYLRFTADVDLILDLDEDNVRKAIEVFASLGYRPHVPVPIEEFIDAARRAQWIAEKRLTVFSLFSPMHEGTRIDLFVDDPLGFEKAYGNAVRMQVLPGIEGTFISMDDLVFLKQQAGRAKDFEDIRMLKKIAESGHGSQG